MRRAFIHPDAARGHCRPDHAQAGILYVRPVQNLQHRGQTVCRRRERARAASRSRPMRAAVSERTRPSNHRWFETASPTSPSLCWDRPAISFQTVRSWSFPVCSTICGKPLWSAPGSSRLESWRVSAISSSSGHSRLTRKVSTRVRPSPTLGDLKGQKDSGQQSARGGGAGKARHVSGRPADRQSSRSDQPRHDRWRGDGPARDDRLRRRKSGDIPLHAASRPHRHHNSDEPEKIRKPPRRQTKMSSANTAANGSRRASSKATRPTTRKLWNN